VAVSPLDPDQQRAASREMWDTVASGWGKRADRVAEWGMPVSVAMVEGLDLQAGQRVLELAAGPGDTGFMAAELIRPGGTLVCSDGAEPMLDVARERARQSGIDNVEFAVLELEWIDLPTASVDAVLCRWGIMLIVDPDAAAHEIRRVLKAGGRAALGVWDVPEQNPWATIPGRALIELGHAEPPDPDAPGMFSLAAPGRLQELLEDAGFVEVRVEPVALERRYERIEQYIEETAELSPMFSGRFGELNEKQRAAVTEMMTREAESFIAADGSVTLPGHTLVALAGA
jgi:ubiquinone/menaquinone biosynthesis C-methylase UbiE